MQGHCTDQANDILNCPAQCWRASFAQTSKKKKKKKKRLLVLQYVSAFAAELWFIGTRQQGN